MHNIPLVLLVLQVNFLVAEKGRSISHDEQHKEENASVSLEHVMHFMWICTEHTKPILYDKL
jgi:hypothetical protein